MCPSPRTGALPDRGTQSAGKERKVVRTGDCRPHTAVEFAGLWGSPALNHCPGRLRKGNQPRGQQSMICHFQRGKGPLWLPRLGRSPVPVPFCNGQRCRCTGLGAKRFRGHRLIIANDSLTAPSERSSRPTSTALRGRGQICGEARSHSPVRSPESGTCGSACQVAGPARPGLGHWRSARARGQHYAHNPGQAPGRALWLSLTSEMTLVREAQRPLQ